MPEYFDEQKDQISYWRAVQLWQILIGCAYNQQLITYGQLAEILGYKGAGTMGARLGPIMFYCQQEELPPLTILAINVAEGVPGDGFELDTDIYDTIDEARMDVFQTDWYNIIPPTPEEFKLANTGE